MLIGESMHSTSKGVTVPSYINNYKKVKYPICFFVSYSVSSTHDIAVHIRKGLL